MQAANALTREVKYVIPAQRRGCRREAERELTITAPEDVYVQRRCEWPRPSNGTREGINKYAHPDSPLEKIVRHLVQKVRREGEERIALVEDVLDFVTNNVKYHLDPEGYRVQYPIETLVDRRGHCLDSCLLAATLLSLAGVQTGVLQIFEKKPGHAMLGINLTPGGYLPVHLVHSRGVRSEMVNHQFGDYVEERRMKRTNGYPRTFTVPLGNQRSVQYKIDDPRILDGFPAIRHEGRVYVMVEMTMRDWRIPRYAFIKGSQFDTIDRPATATGFNRSIILPTAYRS